MRIGGSFGIILAPHRNPSPATSPGTMDQDRQHQALYWYAVHTKADGERLATDALTRKGFEAYLPATIVTIRHARREQIVSRPLFRRYAFVRAADTQVSEVRKTWGVTWVVSNVGKAVVIRPQIIEALRQAEQVGAFDTTRPPPENGGMKAGDRAEIVYGPYAGMIAEIVAMPSDRRIEVILHKVGQRMKSTTTLANLRAVT